MEISALNKLLGNIDIYLLDQVLKGRFTREMKILDAGCGEGRNMVYFLKEGFQIFGVDHNPVAIQMDRIQAKTIRQDYDIHRFQTALVEDLPFHDKAFEAIISSAVLHFARDSGHFFKMVDEMMRVLAPGGIFFMRMCTGYGGILAESSSVRDGVYRLPDGSDRFVLTAELLDQMRHKHHLQFLEAPKSVLVHGQRAMGVFVMEKP